jgi:hypothetical protein
MPQRKTSVDPFVTWSGSDLAIGMHLLKWALDRIPSRSLAHDRKWKAFQKRWLELLDERRKRSERLLFSVLDSGKQVRLMRDSKRGARLRELLKETQSCP